MGQAAYTKKIRVSTTGTGNWQEVPATSPSLDLGGDVLDDTSLVNTVGYRSRIVGLIDWSVTCDSNYKSGDAALAIIRNAKINRTDIYVQYLPEGVSKLSSGFQGKVVVESFNLSGGVGELETVGISLQANGALATAS